METIMRIRSSGKILNLSDKFSDILTIDYLLRSSDRFMRDRLSAEARRRESRRKYTTTTEKTSLPDLDEPKSSSENLYDKMVNDAPGSSGEMLNDSPFSYEQFPDPPSDTKEAQSTTKSRNRKYQREKLRNMPHELVGSKYNQRRRKYIQIHNKFDSVRLEVLRNGSVARTNKEITKFCKYQNIAQFGWIHLVYIKRH